MNQDYSKLTYEEVKEEYERNFYTDLGLHQLIEYLEEHQAESLVRDFMEYQLTHCLIEEIPF